MYIIYLYIKFSYTNIAFPPSNEHPMNIFWIHTGVFELRGNSGPDYLPESVLDQKTPRKGPKVTYYRLDGATKS